MSTIKKIELKVSIHCQKCKKDVLNAVTKLCGIDQVSVDAAKWALTVIGDVDPVMIVKQIRKAGKCAELLTVGPPKPPEKPKSPKKDVIILPLFCEACQHVSVSSAVSVSTCSIL